MGADQIWVGEIWTPARQKGSTVTRSFSHERLPLDGLPIIKNNSQEIGEAETVPLGQ